MKRQRIATLLASLLSSNILLADVELEPNNDSNSANKFTNGQPVYGQLYSAQDIDWFIFDGEFPEEIPISFSCNQAAYYYYYYNPYFYNITAYNKTGTIISTYLLPLSICSYNFSNSYTMHLNGSDNGVASISVSAQTDTQSCPYCYYGGFANYTSEYLISIAQSDSTASPAIDYVFGKVAKKSKIKKDLRQHADSLRIKIKGCSSENISSSIVISGNKLKLPEITPQTKISLEVGNWRCDATGTWKSSIYNQGNLFTATKPE